MTHLIQTPWATGKEAKRVGGVKLREPISALLRTGKGMRGSVSLTCLRIAHPTASELWLAIAHHPCLSPAACTLSGAGSGDAQLLTVCGAPIAAGTQPLCQPRGPAACLSAYLTTLPSSSSGHSGYIRSPSATRCMDVGT